ncbi:hypothetical protein INR49_028106 [Caranx melampygus]|nr:hypothetical protein INR49_016004 [Caranx melampygus]KAG7239974.1 hypothetical protein INR49_028106 [Caranx melampygus]
MRRLGSVQQKIPCVFVTEVKEEQSRKRAGQPFQVVATDTVNPIALEASVDCALATEKLDGTCCYVTVYKGEAYLWARLDRKPNKQAEKRFKKHQHTHRSCKGPTPLLSTCQWNVEEDFKTVPETWIPAHRVKHHNGRPLPDEHGHIPGWVPVEKDNKQYCWHSSVVDYQAGKALVLRPSADGGEDELEIAAIRNPPPVDFQQLCSWFQESPDGRVEGIVWHCNDGTLIKVHRHHLGLRWPDGEPSFSERPVVVRVDREVSEYDGSTDLFSSFSSLSGRCFSRLQDVHFNP